MNEEERMHIYERALHHMRTGQYDWAIIEDVVEPDNYIQCGAMSDTYEYLLVEVTSRTHDDQELPALSSGHIENLVALGFSREAAPNHAQRIPFVNHAQIAQLFEQCFAILGSDVGFEAEVMDVGFWESHLDEMEATAREKALQRQGH